MGRVFFALLGAGLIAAVPQLSAARKNASGPAPDQIEVIAHLPLAGLPVTRLTTGTHWERSYLYLDRGAGGSVTVLDVTNPAAPAAAGALRMPALDAAGQLNEVVGNVALVSLPAAGSRAAMPRTVSIVSYADPEHPRVERQFLGVTAMAQDAARRVTYLTNGDGLWILRAKPAPDLESLREYAHYLMYNP
jgi:hypothetical protein